MAIDYEYRPEAYWGGAAEHAAQLRGEVRYRAAQEALSPGRSGDVESLVAADKRPLAERQIAGTMHPKMMSGEYLPESPGGSVEIARVTLDSTTGDVISVRASQADGRIEFSIVDEYGTRFDFQPRSSSRPLSLHELVRLIDSAEGSENGTHGLTSTFREMNLTDDPWDLVDFVTVSSLYYPQLQEHYETEAKAWAEQAAARLASGELREE